VPHPMKTWGRVCSAPVPPPHGNGLLLGVLGINFRLEALVQNAINKQAEALNHGLETQTMTFCSKVEASISIKISSSSYLETRFPLTINIQRK
jgi:hypothetical protein